MNRKPIFDAIRTLIGRGFTAAEVRLLDAAIDQAGQDIAGDPHQPRLGALSARFESGGRGPGSVSSGRGDPGGPSYGTYQLASRTGTCTAFLREEGQPWADRFGSSMPGSQAFGAIWKAIAAEQPDQFGQAQHAFIERNHYRPLVEAIRQRCGFDLDRRHQAVRDATWSCAVQHGNAARFLAPAVAAADRRGPRTNADYDSWLIEEIYRARTDYVRALAARPALPPAQQRQLQAITRTRYPQELAAALAMIRA